MPSRSHQKAILYALPATTPPPGAPATCIPPRTHTPSCLPAQRAPSTGNCRAFLKTDSAASWQLRPQGPGGTWLPPPPRAPQKGATPFGCPLHLGLHGEREAQPGLTGITREGPHASFLPGALGEDLPGWGGGRLLFKSASISSSSLPAEQGDGEPRPDAIPFRSRPGNRPSCSCLRPGALDTGPSHCAGEGGREQSVTRRPPPPRRPLLPPTSGTAGPPTSATRAGHRIAQAELSSTRPGGGPQAGTPAAAPPGRGSDAPESRAVQAWGGGSRAGPSGVTGEGKEGPSGRGAGGGGGRRGSARGHKVTWGWGHLSAPGEGPVPRQGSSPKAIYPLGQLGFARAAAGRGGVEARALRGAAGRNLGAPGSHPAGVGPRVPGGK